LSVWKGFLQKNSHESEVARFLDLARQMPADDGTASLQSGSWRVLAPAFLVSELKEAFATGFSLFLPFLVIELVVAHLLVAVGLERLSPGVVSLPFKLLVFVLVDGWTLITTGLVTSYI